MVWIIQELTKSGRGYRQGKIKKLKFRTKNEAEEYSNSSKKVTEIYQVEFIDPNQIKKKA